MNEQLLALINKLISKIDSIAPSLADSEEVLLATKALQELANTQAHGENIDDIKQAIADLEALIYSIDSSLKALINANDVDISNLNTLISANDADISNLNTLISANDTDISNLNALISANDTDISNLNALIDTNASDITALSNDINTHIADFNNPHKVEPDRVPVGTIVAYYGAVAPDGYLLCDGNVISSIDYPALVSHLSQLRQTKFKTTGPLNYNGGNWKNGLIEMGDFKGITWVNTDDNTHLNNLALLEKVITPSGNGNLVAVIQEYADNGSVDTTTGIRYSMSNARYKIEMIHGSWEEFKKAVFAKSIDIYNSIVDIELKSASYLPDLRGMFIRGYDSRADREVMSSESDAIRNINGRYNPTFYPDARGHKKQIGVTFSGVFYGFRENDDCYTPKSDVLQYESTGNHILFFDASRVVPTAGENRPINVNPSFIIKT